MALADVPVGDPRGQQITVGRDEPLCERIRLVEPVPRLEAADEPFALTVVLANAGQEVVRPAEPARRVAGRIGMVCGDRGRQRASTSDSPNAPRARRRLNTPSSGNWRIFTAYSTAGPPPPRASPAPAPSPRAIGTTPRYSPGAPRRLSRTSSSQK